MMLPHAAAGAACYVYYRVNAAQLDTARGALATFLADVRARTGVEGSLSRRIDPESGVSAEADVTLMEVYAGIADPAAFEAQLQDAVRRCSLERVIAAGARRSIEWFVPLPDAGNPAARESR